MGPTQVFGSSEELRKLTGAPGSLPVAPKRSAMGARAALDLSGWPTPDISWDDAQSLLAAGGFSPFALPRWMGKTRAQIVAMVSARIEAVSAECAEREQMLSAEWAVE